MTPFAKNLRRIMDERGMTATELARESGVHINSIFDYLRSGRREPMVSTARLLKDALGCSWEELLDGEGER